MEIDRIIGKILQGYQPACVVITANELKIFDELKQPITPKQVAKNRNLDPEACARLLNALTSLEIITKDNNNYHLPQAFQEFLVTGGSHSMQTVDKAYQRTSIQYGDNWQHISSPAFL